MVYHLMKWEFMRDMMCSDPESFADGMADIIKTEMHLPLPERYIEEFMRIVKDCSCVKTQEGLETCLNLAREDLTPGWKGVHPENREFEIFLQKLDERMKGSIIDFFEKHII